MRVAVIGASGFIGGYLYDFLRREGLDVAGTYFEHKKRDEFIRLDATEAKDVESFLAEKEYDMVVLTAANKNVRECEDNAGLSRLMNVRPVENIIKCLEKRPKVKFLFFSSDYVFDGETGNYRDTGRVDPQVNYGKHKLEAEKLLMGSSLDFKIVRTSAVMAPGGVFFDFLVEQLMTRDEVKAFANISFTPTPVAFLLKGIFKLIKEWDNIPDKLVHIVGRQKVTRYEFCLLVKSVLRGARARVIPEEADLSKTTMRKDLSLVCSDIFTGSPYDLKESLRKEVSGD